VRSVRLHAPGDLRVQDELVPIAGRGEKLVRVKAVGICGSDLHWFSEGGIGDAVLEHPLVLGHEFSGELEDGQRVAVDPAIPCRKCEWCVKGNPNLCPQVIFAGHDKADGALREFMAWDEQCLFALPDALSFEDGVMLEPLGVAIHAVDLAHLKPGMTVGVLGCGPIGLLIIQLARLSGAVNIVATDKFPHRVDAARALGADRALITDGTPDVSPILAAAGARGVDVAFEAAGERGAVDDAFAAVTPGGKVILAGIPADDKSSFSAGMARRKGLTIKLVRRMKHTYPRAIDLVEKGMVDVRSIITHRFPLTEALEAFRVAERREGLKITIEV
jgi:L-iditol 2-dehydrogenase